MPVKTDQFTDWEFPLALDLPRDELHGMWLNQLAEIPFEQLGRFKQAQSFPHGYSREYLTFYAPRDTGVHMVLLWTLLQAKSSVAINMYGFDDPHLAALLRHHAENPQLMVTLTLDSSQAAGVDRDAAAASSCATTYRGNSIAIGRSERGTISHDKLMVVDGLYLVTGSTNWSFGGENLQDNQLTLTRDPIACAEARAVIDLDHDMMLKQMAAATRGKSATRRVVSGRSWSGSARGTLRWDLERREARDERGRRTPRDWLRRTDRARRHKRDARGACGRRGRPPNDARRPREARTAPATAPRRPRSPRRRYFTDADRPEVARTACAAAGRRRAA